MEVLPLLFELLLYSLLFVLASAILFWCYQTYVIRTYSFAYDDGKVIPGPPPSFIFGNLKQVGKYKVIVHSSNNGRQFIMLWRNGAKNTATPTNFGWD